MMIRDDVTAAGAAARVGYESASQFNREFKRLFGRSPEKRRARCARIRAYGTRATGSRSGYPLTERFRQAAKVNLSLHQALPQQSCGISRVGGVFVNNIR